MSPFFVNTFFYRDKVVNVLTLCNDNGFSRCPVGYISAQFVHSDSQWSCQEENTWMARGLSEVPPHNVQIQGLMAFKCALGDAESLLRWMRVRDVLRLCQQVTDSWQLPRVEYYSWVVLRKPLITEWHLRIWRCQKRKSTVIDLLRLRKEVTRSRVMWTSGWRAQRRRGPAWMPDL